MYKTPDTVRAQVFLSQMGIKATPENIKMIIETFKKDNENETN